MVAVCRWSVLEAALRSVTRHSAFYFCLAQAAGWWGSLLENVVVSTASATIAKSAARFVASRRRTDTQTFRCETTHRDRPGDAIACTRTVGEFETASAVSDATSLSTDTSIGCGDPYFREAVLNRDRTAGAFRCAVPKCSVAGADHLEAVHIVPLSEPERASDAGYNINDTRYD